MDTRYQIHTTDDLESILGKPMDFVRVKIRDSLDEVMTEFIQRSPLVFVSTIDENGQVDISPKGDPEGFIQTPNAKELLIPERPGNKLAFGFRNILRNGEIGLIFVIPNQRETLRVKGTATLHYDPKLLATMEVNGKPALMYTRVAITECFIHCGKAMIRSKMWKPESWDSSTKSLGAKQFASLSGGSDEAVQATEEKLEVSYKDELY